MGKMTKSPTSPYGWEFIDDLSAVTEDEDAIIEFLSHRLGRGQIYTWVGPLLLAINPGKYIIRDLYNEWHQKAFAGDSILGLQKPSPHIYAVAARAQYRLTHGLGKVCQVIVISGESGTGKTFNARKALDFLAATNGTSNGFGNSPDVYCIIHKISNVFPLLSAFSTASTENNARSSRHGQLLRLQYDKNGVIRGACINSFLLERTRVTAGSNNFDIFYQLIVGLSDEEIEELGLSRDGKYAMLGDSSDSRDRQRFLEGFQSTIRAFEALGFTNQCKTDIFRVIALLMHLGNISFRQKPGEGCTIDLKDDESRKALGNACSLIELPEEELTELLTSILISPQSSQRKHTSYRRELKTIEDCRNRLCSIARYLYERLFHWIVDRVNESLTANGESYDYLGILDIFGFESFETNGLEQLCINYSTERLQLYFMEDYLEAGQRELEEEGVDVLPPSFAIQIYRERISAIETIVFSTFNDACQSPIPPCLSSLRQQFLSKEKEAARFFSIKNDVFVIKHYSRAVAYNVDNLLSKNTDKVPTELSSAFDRCNNKLLRSLSEVEEENVYKIGCRVSLKKCTALAKLKQSLDCLVKELNKCDSHYVRCTRPRHVDGLWAKNEFREQLACTGILDALPLAKCKFPIRFTHEEFYKRYSMKRVETDRDLLRYLGTIINSKNVNSSELHFGKRLVFLTEQIFLELEHYRRNHRSQCARRIQSFWLKSRETRRKRARAPKIAVNPPSPTVEEIEEIEEPLKNICQITIVVTKPSQSSSEEDDVFTKRLQSAEDVENNNDPNDSDWQRKSNSNMTSVRVKESQDFPVTADTGYSTTGEKFSLTKTRSQPSQEEFNVPRNLEKSISGSFQPAEKSQFKKPASEIDNWKEFYLRNWLEATPTNSEEDASINSAETNCDRHSNRFNVKHSQSQIMAKDWTLKIDSNREEFFYRNRILSRRRLVEICIPSRSVCNSLALFWNLCELNTPRDYLLKIPIRFHTRLSCLSGSHRIPRSMEPRGLEDCLSDQMDRIEYVGC